MKNLLHIGLAIITLAFASACASKTPAKGTCCGGKTYVPTGK